MGTRESTLNRTDWLICGAFGALAAVLYGFMTAGFAYPGEGARLMVAWRGLDVASGGTYPLMSFFAKMLGGGNAIAPVCGALSTASLFVLTTFFVRRSVRGESMSSFRVVASRLAGVTAAAVYMLSPAVLSAATHLEPRMFSATWALLAAMMAIPWLRASRRAARLYTLAFGAMWGLGLLDTPLFAMLFPLAAALPAAMAVANGRKPYVDPLLFFIAFVVTFVVFASIGADGLEATTLASWDRAVEFCEPGGWLFVLLFAAIPFAVTLFASRNSYNDASGWVPWTFQLAMSFVSVLAVATPLSPSALMAPAGVLPVAACLFAAVVSGAVSAYWYLVAVAPVRVNESRDEAPVASKGRFFAYVAGGLLAVVYVFTVCFSLFTFDSKGGAFADVMAARALDDLGDRKWFVTDGVLDDHLRLVAAKRGRELNIISLSRDLDDDYLAALSKLVKEKGVGGERNSDLVLSLSLGVLPFVQDWFAADPSVTNSVAIFGAPDLWFAAGYTPVPEFMFFGADPSRRVDWSDWANYDTVLRAPKGWGSYRIWKTADPVEKMRLELRRHLGFVANNHGVWLLEQGRDDEALAMFELVLDSIDTDNICALFNVFEMSQAPESKAAARRFDYERRLKAVVDDTNRRYRLWSLSTYYGYIRNPEVLIRLGFAWARSGRPGEALSQIRRAIDIIPSDRRSSVLNMMAALYANEDKRAKSREVYESVLSKNADDHDALVGMMRLAMMEGDNESALKYLERAVAAGGDDPRIRVELAMVALMKQDLGQATSLLKQVTDADQTDLRAWSLLAAVTMQRIDAEADAKAKLALEKELEGEILPMMEKQSRDPNDYYLQTTKAFLLMRKGAERRKEARDALAVAARARPDVTATQDLVMGLDISLDDPESAERHARDVLRRNRNSPLANYVMGSLSLRRDDYDAAEHYLRKAADARQPVVLAMNDLAEVLRRTKRYDEAERYARLAVKADPSLYVAWETLGSTIMDAGGDLDEAERCIGKACEMSKVGGRSEDVRMLVSLARVQVLKGDKKIARVTLRKVQSRLDELSDFEKREYDALMKDVR